MSRLALGLFCALVCGSAGAAELSQIGPLAPSASLIAARPLMTEPALEFTLKTAGGSRTVDIAADFIVAYGDMNGTIYDYALRRVIALDDGKKSFHNVSMYALADFLVQETAYRGQLRQALAAPNAGAAAGQVHVLDPDTGAIASVLVRPAQAAMLDPFWVQSELHVMDGDAPKLARRVAKDGVHFSYGGKEVAFYALSKLKISKDESAGLARWLRAASGLHPAIIDEIVKSGRLPSRIAFARSPLIKKPGAVWALSPGLRVKAVYPVRAGLKVDAIANAPGAAAVSQLLPTIQSAIAGNASGKKSVADYRAAIDAAMKDDKYFQAELLAIEMGLQYGKEADCNAAPDCRAMKDVLAPAVGDERVKALMGALALGNRAQLAAIKRDDVSNSYVVDDFLANDLAGREPDKALPLFAGAIKGNPYLASFYKGIGDVFRLNSEPDLAWFCYDAGRMLEQGAQAPVISGITDREAELAAKYPQLF